MDRCLLKIIICVAVLSLCFGEDIVPVKARMETSVKIVDRDNNVIDERLSIDDYIRNSAGLLYQKKREVDPVTREVVHVVISILNTLKGIEQHLDPEKRQIVVTRGKPHKPVFPSLAPELERKTYLGRTVVIEPIISGNYGKIGEAWLDEQSHLILYLEQETKFQGLTRVKRIETTEFITDVEPDPALFEVPEDYTVVKNFQ